MENRNLMLPADREVMERCRKIMKETGAPMATALREVMSSDPDLQARRERQHRIEQVSNAPRSQVIAVLDGVHRERRTRLRTENQGKVLFIETR